MLQHIRAAVVGILSFTLITGVAYPLVITGIASLAFSSQSTGSLVRRGDVIVGSSLIGQPFSDPKYFWSRPSATSPMPYNGAASSGSNLGPLNPALHDAVKQRVESMRGEHGDDSGRGLTVPIDLVTASASGLDPHITPAAAEYQVRRVARARGIDESVVRQIVAQHTLGRTWGILGEPRVEVLGLNLALDAFTAGSRKSE